MTATTQPTATPRTLDALAARLNPEHLRRDEPLAPYTTFRIGGPADLVYHALVLLAERDLPPTAVIDTLRTRHRGGPPPR